MVGRGGQGVKSAAHILGTAAFLEGYCVQDQPLYGAERRGAPVTAFIRISKDPILERGHESDASFLAVADDSLLDDYADINSADMPGESGLLFANSMRSSEWLKAKCGAGCAVVTLDLTKIAEKILGNRASLSAPLAGVSAKLLGLSLASLEGATKGELVNLGLGANEIEQNLVVARAAFNVVPQFQLLTKIVGAREHERHGVVELSYHRPSESLCTVSATGNTASRRVDWNRVKPVIDYDGCTKCMICYVYCPDSAISIQSSGFPHVDYNACKGCDICYRECPVKAITLVEREGETA